jgi:hypothetical protein
MSGAGSPSNGCLRATKSGCYANGAIPNPRSRDKGACAAHHRRADSRSRHSFYLSRNCTVKRFSSRAELCSSVRQFNECMRGTRGEEQGRSGTPRPGTFPSTSWKRVEECVFCVFPYHAHISEQHQLYRQVTKFRGGGIEEPSHMR